MLPSHEIPEHIQQFLHTCAAPHANRREIRTEALRILSELPPGYAGPLCPNCSMPRYPLHFDGEIWKCTACGSHYQPGTINDPAFANLFRLGGPAGYDPHTGFEAQDRPRKERKHA